MEVTLLIINLWSKGTCGGHYKSTQSGLDSKRDFAVRAGRTEMAEAHQARVQNVVEEMVQILERDNIRVMQAGVFICGNMICASRAHRVCMCVLAAGSHVQLQCRLLWSFHGLHVGGASVHREVSHASGPSSGTGHFRAGEVSGEDNQWWTFVKFLSQATHSGCLMPSTTRLYISLTFLISWYRTLNQTCDQPWPVWPSWDTKWYQFKRIKNHFQCSFCYFWTCLCYLVVLDHKSAINQTQCKLSIHTLNLRLLGATEYLTVGNCQVEITRCYWNNNITRIVWKFK